MGSFLLAVERRETAQTDHLFWTGFNIAVAANTQKNFCLLGLFNPATILLESLGDLPQVVLRSVHLRCRSRM